MTSFSAAVSKGPLPGGLKVRGGSPYSQYEMLSGDSVGLPSQSLGDNWHRTPGSKLSNKPAASSWPPGGVSVWCSMVALALGSC